jgi:hypothetical protein
MVIVPVGSTTNILIFNSLFWRNAEISCLLWLPNRKIGWLVKRQAGGGGNTPSGEQAAKIQFLLSGPEQNSRFVPGFMLFSAALNFFWKSSELVPFSGTVVLLGF